MQPIDAQDVIRRYTNGQRSRSKLAALAGCSRSKVDRILMNAGFDLTPGYVSAEQRIAMVSAYHNGATVRELSMRWKLADSTVINTLVSSGVQLRRQGRRPGTRGRQIRNLTPAQVLAAYDDGGIRSLAGALNSSPSTAYRTYRAAVEKQRTVDTAAEPAGELVDAR